MSSIRIKRHDLYKNWALPKTPHDSPFPAESALFNRLKERPTAFFHPYQFSYTDDDAYNYHLAFLVEAVELLPDKVDTSFDAVWRAFESYYGGQVIAPKDFKIQQEAPGIATDLACESELQPALDQLLKIIPVQSCEYLTQRIMKDWGIDMIGNTRTDYRLIFNRLENPPGKHPQVIPFLEKVARKYGAPSPVPDSARRAAMLLRLALHGDEVEIDGSKITLPQDQRISFLINALLYTFRNDRFHGNMQPPFKSSVGTLQTYAHAHYCFLWAHFLFLFALSKKMPSITSSKIAVNTIQNLTTFSTFYDKHLMA